jgi:hypothetical protein
VPDGDWGELTADISAELATVTLRAMRLSRAATLALATLTVVAGGCSSDDESGAASLVSTTGPQATLPRDTTSSSVTSATSASSPPSASSASPASTSTTASAPLAAAPSPTGVPGIAAGDALCANWARYSGSLQIVAVAANFAGLSPLELAALELESAPTVQSAVAAIAAAWPAELDAERTAALDGYLGPFARRAAKAVDALRTAGFTNEDLAATERSWGEVLATRDPDQPMVTVSLPATARPMLAAGASAFDEAVTPFTEDPSLQVRLDSVPATKAFLARNCPELASIGVGDDV